MTTSNRNRSRGLVARLLLSGLLLFAAGAAGAATITIVNNDGAGEGFNDPAARVPIGGNPGLTLGDQRLFIFSHAASIWGGILSSPVTILVRAQFNAQTCNATSAVLGSAGPVTIHRDFAGAPVAGHWYHAALANKLAGMDLSVANPDINATFNSQIDTGCFGPGLVWYYGTDGLEGVNIELLPVVLHELGHGLGFSTTTSGSSGNYNSLFPSIFDMFLQDNVSGLHWDQMTPAQRVASAISVDKLVWDGPQGIVEAGAWLGPRPNMNVTAPPLGTMAVQAATFGAAITLGGITRDIVLVDDGVAPNQDGCEALINGGAVSGKFALIERGTCTFVIKAQNAQNAGAHGVIVYNNQAGLPPMGGSDPGITIPCVGISSADGAAIIAALGGGPVTATIALNPAQLSGADNNGKPLMYAPNPFQGGSSVSHWDVTQSPNTLMEPSINVDLHNVVDITHGHFVDIGWFPETVDVTLAEFSAEGQADGVMLRWRFEDLTEVGTITLERATSLEGPWAPIRTELGQDGAVTTALDTNAEPGTLYHYHLRITDRAGEASVVGLASATRLLESMRISLGTPTPNPAMDGTSLRFRIGQAQNVKLTITDVSGRVVRTLQNGRMQSGEHLTRWDGMNEHGDRAPAGVYFIRLATDAGVRNERVTIVR